MIAILGAVILIAAPPKVDLSPFDLSVWTYPGTEPYSKGMSGGSTEAYRHAQCSIMQTTPDAFDKVVAHYLGLAGTSQRNFSSTYIDVLEDSRDRPVKLTVIERRWTYGIVTVVISRAEIEKKTHIVLSYRTPTVPGPDVPIPPVPEPSRRP